MSRPETTDAGESRGNLVELVQLLLDLDAKQGGDSLMLPGGGDHAMLVAQ